MIFLLLDHSLYHVNCILSSILKGQQNLSLFCQVCFMVFASHLNKTLKLCLCPHSLLNITTVRTPPHHSTPPALPLSKLTHGSPFQNLFPWIFLSCWYSLSSLLESSCLFILLRLTWVMVNFFPALTVHSSWSHLIGSIEMPLIDDKYHNDICKMRIAFEFQIHVTSGPLSYRMFMCLEQCLSTCPSLNPWSSCTPKELLTPFTLTHSLITLTYNSLECFLSIPKNGI